VCDSDCKYQINPDVYGSTSCNGQVRGGSVCDTNCQPRPIERCEINIDTTSPLPSGTVGQAYSTTLQASGNDFANGEPCKPYYWSLYSGSLPPGLSLSTSGVISGIPTVANTYTFGVIVFDQAIQQSATKEFTLTINPVNIDVCAAIDITTSSPLPDGTVGQAYSTTLQATGGQTPYSWARAPGPGLLPSGLTLSSGGVISGTPAAGSQGTYKFNATATDSCTLTGGPASATKEFTLTIGQCVPESDTQFCLRYGKNCGSYTNTDNCGTTRTVNCGTCVAPAICGSIIPNVCSQGSKCGNGIIDDKSEQCDDGNLNGQTCQSLGFVSGSLGCTALCTFDTSSCSSNRPPAVTQMRIFAGSCVNGQSLTVACDATDPDQASSTLTVKGWLGQCPSAGCSPATAAWNTADPNDKIYLNGYTDGLMTYSAGNTFLYTFTVNQPVGTSIAATCQARDNQKALSNWGDAYPLCNVIDNPPTVRITNPANGATVSSTVSVTADASDDIGVTKVEFYVDNVLKSTDTTAPYSWQWDTTAYANGLHTIKAIAYDAVGQTATDQISVNVNNAGRNFVLSLQVTIKTPSYGDIVYAEVSGAVNNPDGSRWKYAGPTNTAQTSPTTLTAITIDTTTRGSLNYFTEEGTTPEAVTASTYTGAPEYKWRIPLSTLKYHSQVCVTGSNADTGESATSCDTFTVSSVPSMPVADFIGNPRSGSAPLSVQFTDASTGSISTWSWTFGDGGTSSQQNPSHVYSNPGTYTVSLTVTGSSGSDTETKVDYITVQPPAPVGTIDVKVEYTDVTNNIVPLTSSGIPNITRSMPINILATGTYNTEKCTDKNCQARYQVDSSSWADMNYDPFRLGFAASPLSSALQCDTTHTLTVTFTKTAGAGSGTTGSNMTSFYVSCIPRVTVNPVEKRVVVGDKLAKAFDVSVWNPLGAAISGTLTMTTLKPEQSYILGWLDLQGDTGGTHSTPLYVDSLNSATKTVTLNNIGAARSGAYTLRFTAADQSTGKQYVGTAALLVFAEALSEFAAWQLLILALIALLVFYKYGDLREEKVKNRGSRHATSRHRRR